MSDDLKERLRRVAFRHPQPPSIADGLQQAADALDARDAEIAWLREALHWYANPERYDLCVVSDQERGGYTCDIIMDRGRIARTALNRGGDEG